MSNTEGVETGIAQAVAPAATNPASAASSSDETAETLKARISALEKDINNVKSVKDKEIGKKSQETEQERRARVDLEQRLALAEQALRERDDLIVKQYEQYDPEKAKEVKEQRTQQQARNADIEAGWARWENHALKTALAAGFGLSEATALAAVRGNPEVVSANFAAAISKKKAEAETVTDRDTLKKELLAELRAEGALAAPAAAKVPVTPVDANASPNGGHKFSDKEYDDAEAEVRKARTPAERLAARKKFQAVAARYKKEQTA